MNFKVKSLIGKFNKQGDARATEGSKYATTEEVEEFSRHAESLVSLSENEESSAAIEDAIFEDMEVDEATHNVKQEPPKPKPQRSSDVVVELMTSSPEFFINSVNFEAYDSLMPVFESYNDGAEIDSSGQYLVAIPNQDGSVFFPRAWVQMKPMFVDEVFKTIAIATQTDSTKLKPVMIADEQFNFWAKETYSESVRRNRISETSKNEEDVAVTKSWLTDILSTAVQNDCTDVHMYLREDFLIKFRSRNKIQEYMTIVESSHDGRRLFNTIINDLGSSRGSGRMNYVDFEGTAFPYTVRVNSNDDQEKKTVELRIEKAPIDGGLQQESAGLYIRISKNDEPQNLEQLKIAPGIAKLFREKMQEPQGLILVTGPTGSGKTTLLHAILREIPPGLAARTIEDPVELRATYNTNISQMSVSKDKAQEALESVLRQDPDVIMLGEIRDKVMLDTLIQGTLTGHLTLSTLHTNGTIPTLTRMIDIGANAKDLAAEQLLSLIIATRLNKVPCKTCADRYHDLSASQKATVDEYLGTAGEQYKDSLRFINNESENCPSGCRRGVITMRSMQEIIVVDDEVRSFIRAEDWLGLREHLEQCGWQDFEAQVRHQILRGELDLFEVRNVIRIKMYDEKMDYTNLYSTE
ncbi:GspE/PulE family protein [Vibrio parahaemolyticus]